MSADEHVVIVPGIDGLVVCDLLQLIDGIAATTFQEAVEISTIDQFDGSKEHIERVRQLNITGDASAYWGSVMDRTDSDDEEIMGHPTSDEDPSSHTAGVKPDPVRSNLVPLTMRRHTEESRAIWRANLIAALPVDMLPEDREHIADELLEVAITQGNVLRRKRLVDRLMEEAENLEDLSQRPVPKPVHGEVFEEWSNLMADAAEEIRSVL